MGGFPVFISENKILTPKLDKQQTVCDPRYSHTYVMNLNKLSVEKF